MSDAQTGTRTTSCRMCGAQLNWDPDAATLVCPHCGTVNERTPVPSGPWGIESADIEEADLETALAEQPPAGELEETATVACPGCGAEIAFDAHTLAETCPFCATPLARAVSRVSRHPRPKAVLPFALGEAEARDSLRRWLGSRWFAPNGLKAFAGTGRPLAGVYLPHYTYDARAGARYRGQRGDAYTVTIGVGKNRRSVQRVRWRPVSGRVWRDFDDVVVPASETLEGTGDPGAAGWDLQALEPYAERFLAGFRAELPTLGLDAGWARARAEMVEVLRADICRDIGGDRQQIDALETWFADTTFKHVLLPVWLASYRFRGRSFAVAINARTGKVAGRRPYSAWKIALAVAAGLIVAAGIALLVASGR